MSTGPDKSLGDLPTQGVPRLPTKPSLGDLETGADTSGTHSDLEAIAGGLHEDDVEVVDLASKYELLGEIGAGGMGQVLRAKDKRLRRTVAIKRVRADLAGNPQALARFLTEARALAALNHYNIVQLYEYGRTKEGPFFVLEYVDGESLAQRLERGPLPLHEAVSLACQVCDGLFRAHERGIVHRDIKPSNILLTKDGVAKLTDFGLARETAGDSLHTQTGAVLGTLDFMSPEQKVDSTRADAQSDQWSLAATIYQMVTGDVPRVIEPDEIPEPIRGTLLRALKSRTEDRFASITDLRKALHEAITNAQCAAAVPKKLAKGECCHCGEVNDLTRAFCAECGAALRDPCPSCEAQVTVWETYCGACGANVPQVLESRLAEFKKTQERVQSLCQDYFYNDALALSESLKAETHPRFAECRQWAVETAARLEVERHHSEVNNELLYRDALEEFAAGDFTEALQRLQQIPIQMQTEQILDLAQQIRAREREASDLLGRITAAVSAKAYDELESLTTRFLQIKPRHARMAKLRRKVQSWLQRNGRRFNQRADTSEESPISEPDQARIDSKANLRVSKSSGEVSDPNEPAWRQLRHWQFFAAGTVLLVIVVSMAIGTYIRTNFVNGVARGCPPCRS